VTGNRRAKASDGDPEGSEAAVGIGGAAVYGADDAIEDGWQRVGIADDLGGELGELGRR
jgi:hypothetical protein